MPFLLVICLFSGEFNLCCIGNDSLTPLKEIVKLIIKFHGYRLRSATANVMARQKEETTREENERMTDQWYFSFI